MSATENAKKAAPAEESSTQSDSELRQILARQVFRRRLRYLYDRIARIAIATGGVGGIVAILLIFVYLLYEVLPLFHQL